MQITNEMRLALLSLVHIKSYIPISILNRRREFLCGLCMYTTRKCFEEYFVAKTIYISLRILIFFHSKSFFCPNLNSNLKILYLRLSCQASSGWLTCMLDRTAYIYNIWKRKLILVSETEIETNSWIWIVCLSFYIFNPVWSRVRLYDNGWIVLMDSV